MNTENQNICQCGEIITNAMEYCPVCRIPTISGLSCPECGTEIKPHWKWCPNSKCGIQLNEKTEANKESGEEGTSFGDGDDGCLSIDSEEFAQAPTIDISVGDTLGDRYLIEKLLGIGGYGKVYLSKDLEIGERVALKVIGGTKEGMLDRLIHEFKIQKRIDDLSHVIRVYDPRKLEVDGYPIALLPMELADQGNLRHWMEKNRETQERQKICIELFRQACLGVEPIHKAGLLHLDLKPENLLLCGERIKVSDFGIGRFTDELYSSNPENVLRQGIGTPQYMSPEQFSAARQKDIKLQSDIYSLGIVLYELLDGARPFDGEGFELRQKHLNVIPSPLKGETGKYWPIVSRCLQKDPEKRYTNIIQLLSDIDRVDTGKTISVNVSCSQCGHVNINPDAHHCEKCGGDISDHFQPCPKCRRKNRTDVEICQGCHFRVSDHYLALALMDEVEQIKDKEPIEAINLLEKLLKIGINPFGEKPFEIIRKLREDLETVTPFLDKAKGFSSQRRYKEAIQIWKSVLDVFPRHYQATKEVEDSEICIKKVRDLQEKATQKMDEADFINAENILSEALELYPSEETTRNLSSNCRSRREGYRVAIEEAKLTSQTKELNKAKDQIMVALNHSPRSNEALTLRAEILRKTDKANALIKLIRVELSFAEFSKAESNLLSIKEIQRDVSGFKEIEEELSFKEKTFSASIALAQSHLNQLYLTKSEEELDKCLKLCPEASQAKNFLKEIRDKKEHCEEWKEFFEKKLSEAEFIEAENKLELIKDTWITFPSINKMGNLLETKKKEFNSAMDGVKQGLEELDPEKVVEWATLALIICPSSFPASSQLETSKKVVSECEELAENISNFLDEAEFEKVELEVKMLKEKWVNYLELINFEEDLDERRTKYEPLMSSAEKFWKKRNFKKMQQVLKEALEICPNSRKATEQLSLAVESEKRCIDLRKKAKQKAWLGKMKFSLPLNVIIGIFIFSTFNKSYFSQEAILIYIIGIFTFSFIYGLTHKLRKTLLSYEKGFFVNTMKPIAWSAIIIAGSSFAEVSLAVGFLFGFIITFNIFILGFFEY
jgi:serine/threonine protein kinase